MLIARLAQALEEKGTIHTLRRGFAIAGCGHIDLSEAAPEDTRNEKVVKRYAANRLRAVPQLKYHPAREFAIDLVFFFNGLAVATVEVKTDFTQSADAAVEQYKNDRLPFDPKTKRREPLLSFKRGAVVHFAMSESDIRMATKLDGQNSFFLPFNQGKDGHAGKPLFDAAIIVTDRTVLDGQLQDAVQQLDHQKGLIAAIDRDKGSKSKSQQLSEALLKGVPIIVVTIQTLPYAMEEILTEKSLKQKNDAVIIDEAHASQTGTTASKLQATPGLFRS